mmetsp:Transcript_39839/g.55333  ORF Transcript_39839/g.55333 Transcript_39839/m.55333 type:complete len:279 (+) Transcript_39839:19-855(+)|eukprot:CAMPEP_0196592842 /NCGR_PEP_ID=MMETSP1081-20130531/74009_1 /TAXON_ID=36882 /ORGANISM="Pyramimonas amylifera, Strain CCMP720" /LENGTH=278 /DNA_ID=CAMNT_0041916653 /DNA_START=17 /DNA_END=853 /DNA_ORIENTATION=+
MSNRAPIPLRRGPSLNDLLSEWKQLDVNHTAANSSYSYNSNVINSLDNQENNGECLTVYPTNAASTTVQTSGVSDSIVDYRHANVEENINNYDQDFFGLNKTFGGEDIKPMVEKTIPWRQGETAYDNSTKTCSSPTFKESSNAEESADVVVECTNEVGKETVPKEDDKKARRMLSNRESARRSRQRKQQHVDELQGQASQLRAENLNILHRLAMVAQLTENLNNENRRLSNELSSLTTQLTSFVPNPSLLPHQMMQSYASNSPHFHGAMHGIVAHADV